MMVEFGLSFIGIEEDKKEEVEANPDNNTNNDTNKDNNIIKYNLDDVRVRAYNSLNHKPQEFYHEEDKSLEAAMLQSYRAYTLDFRNTSTGYFENFDPDVITLEIYPWTEENIGKTENEFKVLTFKTNKKEHMSVLRQKIVDLIERNFPINEEANPLYNDYMFFKKMDYSNTSFNLIEILNKPEEMYKEIYLCAILDNSKIFVEAKQESLSNSKFLKVFEEKVSSITVRFNFPVNFEQIGGKDKITHALYKWENEIETKRHWTLAKVKQTIAEYLTLSNDQFIMKKHNHNGVEIRNLNDTVNKLENFSFTSMNIYIEFGAPMKDDELKINLMFCENDFSRFKLFPYILTDLGTVVIKTTQDIKDLKHQLIEEVKNKMGLELDPQYTLLREHTTERPAKIFHNDIFVKSLNFTENKKIIIQEYLREKISFHPEQVQVCCRLWDSSTWTLSEPVDIHVTRKSNLKILAETIHVRFPEVSLENISVYKMVNGYNIYMDDVNNFTFQILSQKYESNVDNFPFFLTVDGSILLY
jgi:hypothetical protein